MVYRRLLVISRAALFVIVGLLMTSASGAARQAAPASRYRLAPNFILTITREDARLFAQATGQGRFELSPESARAYFAKVADIVITFEADEQGRSTSLVLQQSGVRTAAKRIE